MKRVIRAARGRDIDPNFDSINSIPERKRMPYDQLREAVEEASDDILENKNAMRYDTHFDDNKVRLSTGSKLFIQPNSAYMTVQVPGTINLREVTDDNYAKLVKIFKDIFAEWRKDKTVVIARDYGYAENFIANTIIPKVEQALIKACAKHDISVHCEPYYYSDYYLDKVKNKRMYALNRACADIRIELDQIKGYDIQDGTLVDLPGSLRTHSFYGFVIDVPLDDPSVCTDNSRDLGFVNLRDYIIDKIEGILTEFYKVVEFSEEFESFIMQVEDDCKVFEQMHSATYPDLSVKCEGYTLYNGDYGVRITVKCYHNQIAFQLDYLAEDYPNIDLESKIKNAIKYRKRRDNIS